MNADCPTRPHTAAEMLAEMGIKRRTRPRGPWRARPPGAFAVLSAHCRLMVAELENGKQLRLTVLFDKKGKITEDPAYVTKARATSPGRDWEVDLVGMWAVPLPSTFETIYH